MATFEEILARSKQIRDETAVGKNTATRVGGVLVDLCQQTQSLISKLDGDIGKLDGRITQLSKDLATGLAGKIGKDDVIDSKNIAKGAITYEKLANSSVSWASLAPELKAYIYTMSGFPEYLLEQMVKGIEFVQQNEDQLSIKVIMADGKSVLVDVPRLSTEEINKILI